MPAVAVLRSLHVTADAMPELMPLLAEDCQLQRGLLRAATWCICRTVQLSLSRATPIPVLASVWWVFGCRELRAELAAWVRTPSGQPLLGQLVECVASMAPAWQLDPDEAQTRELASWHTAAVQLVDAHIIAAAAVAAAAAAASGAAQQRMAAIPYTLLPDSVVQQHLELLLLLPGIGCSLMQQRAADLKSGGTRQPPGCRRILTDGWTAHGVTRCAELAALLPAVQDYDSQSQQEVRWDAHADPIVHCCQQLWQQC